MTRKSFLARILIQESGCWMWTGGKDRQGYGVIKRTGHSTGAHRVSWEMYHSAIPAGLCVLHKCDTPSCVNPNHLFLGTRLDNSRDAKIKNRSIGSQPKVYCKRGHELSLTADYFPKSDGRIARQCRECNRIRVSNYQQRKRLSFV